MNRKIFETCVTFFNRNTSARYALHFIYKVLPIIVFVTYPAMLLRVFLFAPAELPKLVAVPLCVLVGVSLLRIIVNEKRPYERYGQPSVFHKETKGKSFPSRHTASAFIIAMALLYFDTTWGILGLITALLIEISRILAGAHYIHDVVASMVISIVVGWIFFFVL